MSTSTTAREWVVYRAVALSLGLLIMAVPHAATAAPVNDAADLAQLSLEDLLNMEITTLSRKAEDLADAPAAVHVISQSDIQRSGARTIPDLLRMVPGMQVAQIDGNKWAVTARGNNGRFANKLLVLIDGRSVYSASFAGVNWDAQDTDLSTIERIEVIRGPGATMWGANAVNGVVNIITKNAADTVGGHATLLTGNRGSAEGVFRYGAQLDEFAFRVYGKATTHDGNIDLAGLETGDSWNMSRLGTRFDWSFEDGDEMTLSAEAYSGELGETRVVQSLAPPFQTIQNAKDDVDGAFVQFNWSNSLDNGSSIQLRTFFATEERRIIEIDEDRWTFDFDLQHSISLGQRHDLMWGLGYRRNSDDTTGTFLTMLTPSSRSWTRTSAFVQDDIRITDAFRVMVGSKFENSEITDGDIEVEPSVRFSLRLNEQHSIWASASRALRLPSRGEVDGQLVSGVLPPGNPAFPLPVPAVLPAGSNGQMVAEEAVAIEAGYRYRKNDLLFDVSFFYNDYDKNRSVSTGIPTCQPSGDIIALNPACLGTSTHVEIPLILGNESSSETAGAEFWLSKQITDWWQVQAAYTYFHELDSFAPPNPAFEFIEDSPEHQVSVRSTMDIGDDFDLDLWVRHVGAYENAQIDDYTALDLRFAWSPSASIEVSAVGRNLLAGEHVEFVSETADIVPVQIEPEGYIELRWSF